jgi:hypothetical protein
MRDPPPLQFIRPLQYKRNVSSQAQPASSNTPHTFSFKCSTNTITAKTTVATTDVNVTQGIHSPGLKNNSFFHPLSPVEGGRMTTRELGMTPSMFSQCFGVCLVEPTKRFSM